MRKYKDPRTIPRPSSAPETKASFSRSLDDFNKLTIGPSLQGIPSEFVSRPDNAVSNPLKRSAGGHPDSLRRIRGPYSKDPTWNINDFEKSHNVQTTDQRPGHDSGKHLVSSQRGNRLVAASQDRRLKFGSLDNRHGTHERNNQPRRIHDRRTHVFRHKPRPSRNETSPSPGTINVLEKLKEFRSAFPKDESTRQTSNNPQPSPSEQVSSSNSSPVDLEPEVDPIPVMIKQPQTREITHDQLVVEVKGRFNDLDLVEYILSSKVSMLALSW